MSLNVRPALLLVLFLFISLHARAEDAPASPTVEKDEYDFSWLDPEKKIYVVQNRKYTKKQRLEVAVSGGIGIGEPYRTTRFFLPKAFYYINETFGLSVFGVFSSNKENNNMIALKSASSNSSVLPTVRDVQSLYGASVMYVPFYGKINMYNQIFYMDWHFEAGVNQVSSEIDLNTSKTGSPKITSGTFTGFHWGTGQKFFINRNLGFRIDYLAVFYNAPNALNGVLDGTTERYDNHYLSIGASYTF